MYPSCEILTARYTIIQIHLNDNNHGEMYQEACSLAHSFDINPSKPRICGRQQHCSNAHDSEDTVEGYYRINSFCCISIYGMLGREAHLLLQLAQ